MLAVEAMVESWECCQRLHLSTLRHDIRIEIEIASCLDLISLEGCYRVFILHGESDLVL